MAVVGTVTLLVGLACLLPAMIRPTCALLADGIYREKVNENEPVVVVTDMLFLDQDTFLYSEQYGKVYICQRANGDLNKQLYVDLESVTHGGGNKGILDMLLDDDFENSKQVWFYYSRNEVPGPAGAAAMTHRVSRFTHIDNQGGLTQRLDPNSEVPVWVDPEGYPDLPLALHWHYGSQLVWGPGGMLYFAQGDKMINPDWASDINYFAGCLIRMNKDGTFPADNDGVQAGGAPGCWGADGLRSPWRVHYDEPTNRFIIGDVGGNDQDTAVEEIHIYRDDMGFVNFGWPHCEGSNCQYTLPNNVYPALEWPHNGYSAAVIGGFVYRAQMFPPELQGKYIFADYGQQWMRYISFDASGLNVVENKIFDDYPGPVTAIELAPDGSVWQANLYGEIYRYWSDYEGNPPPPPPPPPQQQTTKEPTTTTSTSTTSTTTTTVITTTTLEPTTSTTSTPEATTPPGYPITLVFEAVPVNAITEMNIDGEVVSLPYTLHTYIDAHHEIEAIRDRCDVSSGNFYRFRGWGWGGPDRQVIRANSAWRTWRLYYNNKKNPSQYNCFQAQ